MSCQGSAASQEFRSRWSMTGAMVSRLGLVTELTGHNGCVNCLQWSISGQFLLSGSDDKTSRLETPHEANIFSYVWPPGSDETLVARGAGDSKVCLVSPETGAQTKR